MPRAKIEVILISDAYRAASPASPIPSLVYRGRYPRALSSLVIPTWVIERLTVLPVESVDSNHHISSKMKKPGRRDD